MEVNQSLNLALYGNIRVRENLYSGSFYVVIYILIL